jgi:integrase
MWRAHRRTRAADRSRSVLAASTRSRSPVAVLSPGQVDGILAYASGTTDAALWGSMALAGLRLGETLGLADHDVDLDTGLADHSRRSNR